MPKKKPSHTKHSHRETVSRKTSANPDKSSAPSSRSPENEKTASLREDGWRETIESIVIAFVLAFLFRTFEAEAFVIPTGSMAPTLYGRHKDIVCEKCNYRFAVGASDELVRGTTLLDPDKRKRVGDVVCPNCRYVTPANVVNELPVYKGDRILVVKFPYEFGNPQRWDVLVFKYPEEATTNYIKRLVGLPGDELEIRQGDVYHKTKNGWEILRKEDPDKQRKLQILVYDNDHPARDLLKSGWPERWAPVRQANMPQSDGTLWQEEADGWKADVEARSFHLRGKGRKTDTYRWIRYRHYVPSEQDWNNVLQGKQTEQPRSRLITDFCGYNAYTGARMRGTPQDRGYDLDLGVHWVGDLTINCDVVIHESDKNGELLLELIEGFRTYRCRFHINSGLCEIFHFVDQSRDEEEKILGRARTTLKGPGRYRVAFANVDDRLCVWVNDRLVSFGNEDQNGRKTSGDGTYQPYGGAGGYQRVTRRDLSPVGIAARGCDVTVSHLLLQRDIYYRAEKFVDEYGRSEEYEYNLRAGGKGVELPDEIARKRTPSNHLHQTETEVRFDRLYALQSDPELWWQEYSGGEGHPRLRPARFEPLGPDEYFMLGDNSPKSQDSRLWPNSRGAPHRHAVPRQLLVGKAFFVYWPHGIPFLNDGKGYPLTYHRTPDGQKSDYPSFRIPFYPNFRRMRRIR